VEGIFRLLHSDYVYPINIGNPDEITIKDFADEIIKLTGTNQKWFIFLYQSMILCNDNQTLQKRELLGWEAKVNRAEGMKITYDYFRSMSKEELSKEEHKDFSKYIS
jgi:dTDP-glucose 4,6-dehydratase